MSNVLTLLFAPTFLLLIQYFEFKTITLIYILFSLFIIFYVYITTRKSEEFTIAFVYLIMLILAYFTNNFNTIKFIPVISALAFFSIFAFAALHKKELIYKFTTKVYKKELTEAEILFLKNGDAFWAMSILFYALFLSILVYYGDDNIWAFFSSVGWYIYFVITLIIQVTYGKLYAIKMYTK